MTSPLLTRILWVRGLRAFADGYISLLLPIYLISLGMGPFEVGIIATATLLGSGVLTLIVGLHAWRFQSHTLLLAAAVLMAATGLGFATISDFWPLLIVAAVGTLNPSSGDVSVFLPLEHALLSRTVPDKQRTAVFARYSLIGSLLAAAGALFAAVPDYAVTKFEVERQLVMQALFVLYGLIGVVCALIYRHIPKHADTSEQVTAAPLHKSKKIVFTLAALFSLDSFGCGFVVQSLVALWLYQKFELSTIVTGTIFFWTGVLSAFSYLVAVRIANRIGLVNTMVFTHLPSSIFLILAPFMPTLGWAIALLLARSALSQMDVPTRSSYVMAVVPPEERAAAASVTAVPRSLASALSPMLAGYMLSASAFGWPLVVAGGVKITYDLLLLALCRKVPPPEEERAAS
ncbi:MFS transporter [Noviherbaspirillum sp. Root189]|uniref:MFS transporter n=1 Tax=Noviherbaspirillum sp. Root189 TaxID=1736487 RepID=UPI000710A722|nr:MFS transporter [Noviherbaspirillum sp. Root189]KRB79506.1 ABC transporter permease [Noviherbaspirillum sp. Root189]